MLDNFGNGFGLYKGKPIYFRENRPANGWHYYIHGAVAHYINGICHNETGPACVNRDGKLFWYLNNQQVQCATQQEFLRLIKLKCFW